jgi:dienelactone hydrolase
MQLSTRLRTLLVFAVVALGAAQAQVASPLLEATRLAPDLRYPAEPSRLSAFSGVGMALYKPEGNGPFPALVLHHQCGGLGAGNRVNQSMLEWARSAVAHGYVALLVDSLGPRKVDTVCMGGKGGVNFPRGVRDTLQAAAHLRTLPFVDGERVALAGYSWGGMNTALASSKGWGEPLASGSRFQAAVAFYPGCFTIRPPSGPPYEIVRTDIDRPLLMLMGGKDNETPPAECIPRLELAKAAGAPVQWHVYPNATHCWDCRNLDNFRKTDVRGNQIVYLYDEAITKDSEKRMFEFLDQQLRVQR